MQAISSVQFSRSVMSGSATPGLPVHHQFPEFTQTHVHRVSDAIQPSHPLSSPSPNVSQGFIKARCESAGTHCCCYQVASVVSDSVQPQRRQPPRFPCPWDSPGKNTGVGCHFLLQCMKVKSESDVAQLCLTLSDPMDCSLPGSSIHGIFQARVLEWGAIAFSGGFPYFLQFKSEFGNKEFMIGATVSSQSCFC